MEFDFSLVLPVQNQEDIIELVVEKIIRVLEKTKINYEIVMVENGSTDKTLKVIKKMTGGNNRLRVVVSKPGYGRAVVYGLNQAKGKYIGYMPSDGQCDESVLPHVIKAMQKPEVDLVKVFRTSRESKLRKNVSISFNLLANIIFLLKFWDINASPTVFKKVNLKKLELLAKDSFLDTELLIKARYLKWKIARIPMNNFNRTGGKSTVKPPIVFEFLKNMFDWRFSNKLKAWKNEIK
ncbi:MAG: glycosyltransferase family 2 protein [Candidatus Beckwithbacteria bacterium]